MGRWGFLLVERRRGKGKSAWGVGGAAQVCEVLGGAGQ